MKKAIWVLLVLFLLFILALLVFQPGRHQSSKTSVDRPSKKATSLYQKQAAKVCGMLQTAESLYKKSKSDLAYKQSESAYWDVYDNVLEIKYRSYGTPAEIFAVENKFHDYSLLLKQPSSNALMLKITSSRKDLCQIVKKQADVLDKNS